MYTRVFITGLAAMFALAGAACSDPAAKRQAYLQSGDQFVAQQKFQEAIVEYRNAVGLDERAGDARFKLAEAYAAAGDMRNAFREYVRAADLLPDDTNVQMKAATVLAASGQLEDAKTKVRRVLDRDARNVEAQILLGNILAGQKDLPGAVAQVEEAIQIDPARGTSYANLGVLRLAQGDRDAARAAFDRAVEVDPKSVQARLALAMFQLQLGEPQGAEQSLRAALEIEPAHALANRAMAALLIAWNRAPEAERYLKAFADASKTPQATFLLADYYVSLKRDAEAKSVLQPLTTDAANGAAAESRLASIDYATDQAAAHARLDGVLTRSPQYAPGLLMKARWLLAEGKRDDALAKAQAATKAEPANASAHYLLGVIQAMMLDRPAAIASFNEVLRLNPRVAAAQIQLSRVQLAQGAPAEAMQLAESALKNAPGNPEARLTLASTLLAQRDLSRAEPLIAELLKEYPKVATVHALDGMRQLARKDPVQARAAYDRALQLDPRSFPATSGLVVLDLMEKKTAAAVARVEARLAETPNEVRLLHLAARVFVAANQGARAEQSLRKAIEIAPADSTAYTLLGQFYISQRRMDEARAEFDAVAARNPKNVPARTLAAILSHTGNNIEDAKKRYRAILEVDQNAAVAANNLAWILADEGKELDEALRLAQLAATQVPNSAEIQDTLGWVYYKKELPTLAVPPFEKSIAQAPENPTYHYHLGLAHAKSGNTEEARRAVAAALKLRPDYREALELQASIR